MPQTHSAKPAAAVGDRQAGFRNDIEGLRAVAVLAVVLFHAGVPGVGGGYVGVDVFFVISGFLITGLLWREAASTGTVRLRNFWGARARRLLPASAAVGAVTMVASARVLAPLQVPSVLADGMASALYVGNYWFVVRNVGYFNSHKPPSPFLHYWSLGVEEQFYLVWPVLILVTAWLITRVRRGDPKAATRSARPYQVVLALVAAGSLALSLITTLFVPAVAFFSLPTRAWQLAAGGLVALTIDRWRRLSRPAASTAGWTGMAAIVAGCVLFTEATPYPGAAALLPTAGAMLVIGAGCASTSQGVGRLLAVAPMRAVGRISYSWYLWHWPVLLLVPALLGHPLGLAGRLTLVLVSAVLAVLTLRFVENPLRFAAPIRSSAWRSLGLGGAVTATVLALGVVLVLVRPAQVGPGAPVAPVSVAAAQIPPGSGPGEYEAAVRQTFAEVQAAVEATVDSGANAVPSNLSPSFAEMPGQQRASANQGCLLSLFARVQPECVSGDTASATTVALIGDSHAAMWAPAFQQLATERGWRLETLTKAGCPVFGLHTSSPFRGLIEAFENCRQWSAHVLDRLRAHPPRLAVISVWRGYGGAERLSGFTSYDTAWLDGLSRVVRDLRASGTRVLVLGGIPDPHADVPICLSGHPDDVSACMRPRSTAVNVAGIAAEQTATESAGGQYADLTDLFCTADQCPVIVGNTMVYLDFSHLTPQYARVLAPAVGALAQRTLSAP